MNAALVLRDARCDARRPRTYAVRVVYGLALAFVLERAWSAVGPMQLLPTASDLAQAGRELYQGFFLTQFVVVSLLALVGGAETLGRELRSGTLRLLVLTPVPESGIVASKWGAVMLQSAALALCGAPFLAACAYLGALGAQDVAAGFVVTLANAALAAACGLRGASLARTTGGAVTRGLLGYAGWGLAPVLLALPTAGVALLMSPFLHPAYTVGYLLLPHPMLGSIAVAASSAVAAVLAVHLLRKSSVALARRMQDLPDLLRPLEPEEPTRPWALTWWPSFWRRRDVWDDAPLLWKDLFTRPTARLSVDANAGIAAVAVGVWYMAILVDQGRSLGGLQIQIGVLAALTVLAGSGLFTREKEDRRLEPLLCGPLSAPRIAISRLFAPLLAPETLLLVLMLAFTLVVNARGPVPALALLAVVLLLLLVLHLLAAAASLRMPTLHSAAGLTAGVLAVGGLIVPSIAPETAVWLTPGPVLEALFDGASWTGAFGRYAAAQGATAAALALWIVTRMRPSVLEARR